MNDRSDSQLLLAYAETGSETDFAELVRRHVDFVYSAARRTVCDSHLAEDVTQAVFMALAKSATQLVNRSVLSGWLHSTAQNIAAQTVRTIERRRTREQEATVMTELLSVETDAAWDRIAPQLDTALGELNQTDRDALLLRYFERKSAYEMAQVLGISDEAAQKRVNRAVERLREFFARRGITVGASGLAVVISANAVQAAPERLIIAISTAAALVGTTIGTSATATAIKAIAMTKVQKALVTATIAILAGTGIHEFRQAAALRSRLEAIQQQQAPLTEQVRKLASDRDDLTQKLAALRDENARFDRNNSELLRLRGEVNRLRNGGDGAQPSGLIQGKTEGEWIKSIVYRGDSKQTDQWRALGPQGIQLLLRALKAPPTGQDEEQANLGRQTRMCAAMLLWDLGDDAKTAIPDLINLLKTEKEDSVRHLEIGYFIQPIQSMAEGDKAALLPELVRAMQSNYPSVRDNALAVLQSYPSQADTVVPLMVQSLQDANPMVRLEAVRALNKIDPQNPASANFIIVLVGCLTGSPASQAATMLGELHREPNLAVPALLQALQSSDEDLREKCATALGNFGNQARSAVPALQKALEDSDARVRRLATTALNRINAEAVP